jgi:hypothetical protein
VRYLASDDLEGRLSVDAGGRRAEEYVAAEMARLHLEPAGEGGTYFQAVSIPYARLAPGATLSFEGHGASAALAPEAEWNPLGTAEQARTEGALLFAGFGVVRPEKGYDDYAGVDAKGKVLLVIRREPWAGAPSPRATFVAKLTEAKNRGAAALLMVNDAKTAKATGDRIPHWSASVGAPRGAGLPPFAFVRRDSIRPVLAAAGLDLDALEQGIVGAPGRPRPASRDVPGTRARLVATFARDKPGNARNVAGLLRGSDPALAAEVVLLGAHHDHVGRGWQAGASPAEAGSVHPGADDNASGTAAVLEVAEALAARGSRPRRSVLFVTFTGEEMGLFGSRRYVEAPLLPLARTVAMVNCDMVGRYDPRRRLEIGGVGTGEGLKALVEGANAPYGLRLAWDEDGVAPSDSTKSAIPHPPEFPSPSRRIPAAGGTLPHPRGGSGHRRQPRSLRFCASNSSGVIVPRSSSPSSRSSCTVTSVGAGGGCDQLARRWCSSSIFEWMRFCTLSGWRMSVNRDWPSSPPDSMSRSPAPSMRSKTPWLKLTLFTRSSGISMPLLAITPWRKISRCEVITKLVVSHFR